MKEITINPEDPPINHKITFELPALTYAAFKLKVAKQHLKLKDVLTKLVTDYTGASL